MATLWPWQSSNLCVIKPLPDRNWIPQLNCHSTVLKRSLPCFWGFKIIVFLANVLRHYTCEVFAKFFTYFSVSLWNQIFGYLKFHRLRPKVRLKVTHCKQQQQKSFGESCPSQEQLQRWFQCALFQAPRAVCEISRKKVPSWKTKSWTCYQSTGIALIHIAAWLS